VTTSFDPIEFLHIVDIPAEQIQRLRPLLWADMAKYILDGFLNQRNPKELDEIEKQIDTFSQPQELFNLISSYDPSFEQKKEAILEGYKQQFNLNKFLLFVRYDENTH